MSGTIEQNGRDPWQDPVSAGLFDRSELTTAAAYPLATTAPQAPPANNNNNAVDAMFADAGTVFASKNFEEKLLQFAVAEVASSGRMPPDEAIQAKAKEISGLEVWQAETTPADDPTLLAGFKQLVVDKVKAVLGAHEDRPARLSSPPYQQPPASSILSPSHIPMTERGMDAIDPGLLPALDPAIAMSKTETQILPNTPVVHVAISEKRLEEIIGEIGRGGS